MPVPHDPRKPFSPDVLFTRGVPAVSVITGCVVLTGWALDVPALRSILSGSATMKANTAVCFILSGIAFWFLGGADRSGPAGRLPQILVRGSAATVLLIAGLTLIEHIFGWNPGLDELLFKEPGVVNPGRMAPNTAIAFVLVHSAVLLLTLAKGRGHIVGAGLLGAVTALLGLFAVLGWAGNVSIGYSWGGLGKMVAPTGFLLLLLGWSIAASAWRRTGLLWVVGRRLVVSFTVGLIIFSALSVVAYKSVKELLESADRVSKTQEVLAHVRKLHSNIAEMQSGVRGFVITGREDFLIPYQQGLTSDDPRQQARVELLEALIAQRSVYADEVIELRRRGGVEAAASLVSTGRGLSIMNDIRVVVEEMVHEENILMERRVAEAAASAEKTFFLLPVGTLIGVVLFLGVLFFLNLEAVERRQAAAEAGESEERLGLALQAAEFGHWELDRVTGVAKRTPLHDKLFGYPDLLPEWNYKVFLDHVHPEHRDQVDESIKAGVAAGGWDFECRIIRADNVSRWIWVRGHAVKDGSGKPARVVGLVADITHRKKAETERAYLAAIVESSGDAIISVRPDGTIQTWNRGASGIFGYSEDEAVGRHISMLIPPGLHDEESAITSRLGHTETTYQYETQRRRKDGTLVEVAVTLSPIKGADGEVIGASKTVRDITARKQAEAELARHKEDLEELVRERTAELLKVQAELETRVLERTAELEAQRRHNDLLLNSAGEGLFGLNTDGIVTFINPAGATILGFKVDELVGQSMHTKCHHTYADGRSFPREECPIYAAFRDGQVHRNDDDIMWRKDGTAIPVQYTSTPMRDEGGSIIGSMVVFRDISERKLAVEALQKSEANFKSLFDSANDAIFVLHEGIFTACNPRAQAIFGCPFDEIIGRSPNEFSPSQQPDGRPSEDVWARYTNAALSGAPQSFEWQHLRCDGSGFDTEVSLSRVEIHGSTRLQAIVRDISERKQAETALRDAEQRMRLATEASEVGIWEWNLLTNKVRWDAQMFRIYGIAPSEDGFVNYRQWSDAVLPEDLPQQEAILQETVRNIGRSKREFSIRRGDGELRIVRAEEVVRTNDKGEAEWVVGTNRDITEQKQAEEEVRKLNEELEQRVRDRTQQLEEVNKELEAFSYSISHDLRSPLRHIDGFIKLLAKRESNRLEPDSMRYLETISTAAGRMGLLIDELLAFSRTVRQPLKTARVDLNNLVDRSVNELAHAAIGRKINWEIAPLPDVVGDPTLLGVVMTNLISNAIKYTGQQAEAHIQIGVHEAFDGHATLFVRDNGAGFDMRYTDKLFGVFQRLHRESEFEGIGIGLATVQRIVNRHGGRIWADSEPGKGATFFITLNKAKGDIK